MRASEKLAIAVQVVVDRQQLVGDGSGFGELSGLQICFEKIAQSIRIGIDVGDFLQRCHRAGGIAGLEQVLSLHQQRVGVSRIEGQHALQDFFGAAAAIPWTRRLSAAAEKICQASFFFPRRT